MIVPIGTRVVSKVSIAGTRNAYPEGALMEVLESPVDASHSYRVRLADGFEANLLRSQFAILREVQEAGLVRTPDALGDHELADAVIYRCLIGSRAYGLDTESSDTDTRGIYLAPADRQWSLYGVPEQLENPATDEVYWELQKFLVLALKANPNILEVLHTPIVSHITPLAEELIAMRSSFVSKLVYQTYNGYVLSQFKKMTQRQKRDLEPKWKHAMHLIRLLISGVEALRTGVVPVRVADEHHERLMRIRNGEASLDQVDRWRAALQSEFEHAYRQTTLPDRPDYEAANAFLIRARRASSEATK